MSRRVALGALAVVGGATGAQAADGEDAAGAEATLRAFLKAFENNDLATMEAAFDSRATSFDPVVAGSPDDAPPDLTALRRQNGMPPLMRALARSAPKPGEQPPYRRLDPRDLRVQVEGEVAVCTFHLDGPGSLARRTIVLVRRNRTWKILHIHASNAVNR